MHEENIRVILKYPIIIFTDGNSSLVMMQTERKEIGEGMLLSLNWVLFVGENNWPLKLTLNS